MRADFLYGLPAVLALLPHSEEDAAVDRLEAVAHVRQGAADDHAHRVVEVGALQLLLDGDRDPILPGEERVRHASVLLS